jgi:hypothetical protein
MKKINKYLITNNPNIRGCSSGNINRLSDTVFTFTEYNFLPGSGEGMNFDGHYTFFVDYTNMNWLIYKSSDYGGLTWTKPVEFKDFLRKKDFNKKGLKEVEHIIASKLLGAYFYDCNHIHHKGSSLINDEESYKRSLICDNRGFIWVDNEPQVYKPVEVLALKELISFERKYPDIQIDFSKRTSYVKNYTCDYGVGKNKTKLNLSDRYNVIPITINGISGELVHQIMFSKQTHTGLIINNESYCHYTYSKGLSYYLEMLPTAIRNFAGAPFNP